MAVFVATAATLTNLYLIFDAALLISGLGLPFSLILSIGIGLVTIAIFEIWEYRCDN